MAPTVEAPISQEALIKSLPGHTIHGDWLVLSKYQDLLKMLTWYSLTQKELLIIKNEIAARVSRDAEDEE